MGYESNGRDNDALRWFYGGEAPADLWGEDAWVGAFGGAFNGAELPATLPAECTGRCQAANGVPCHHAAHDSAEGQSAGRAQTAISALHFVHTERRSSESASRKSDSRLDLPIV
ncbi:hypothetical protein BH11PSE9_BH11PSE9_08580 [soil metagenome]